MLAFTRDVSASLAQCELTHLHRVPIDVAVAREQHHAYEQALASLGLRIQRLPRLDEMPDAVFVEDAAVVFPECAVITRPGAVSRRGECETVREALASVRSLHAITAPGTLDGGDVLVLDAEVVVGETARTNAEGIVQLAQILEPYGYTVRGLPVSGCLHLKTAVTRVAQRTLVINPAWISRDAFPAWELIEIDPSEPLSANALMVGDTVIYGSHFPRTHERLAQAGIRVFPVPASELGKAEGGVTCCSLIVT